LKIQKLVLAALFASLTAVCAQIFIVTPFSPVPITLQLLAVFLAGSILGANLGFLSQVVYLLLGAVGAPVFSQFSGGIHILTGITGGYLLSYPIAAYIVGKVISSYKGESPKIKIGIYGLGMCLGLIVIYLLGSIQFGFLTSRTINESLTLTVLPFIIPDLLKLSVSIPIAISIKKALMKANLSVS